MPDHSFSKEIFPNIKSKPHLTQLEAIASRPIASYLGEETNIRLTTPSFQVAVESDKVSPQPPILQTKQPQFPQLLLTRLVLQTLHQPRRSSSPPNPIRPSSPQPPAAQPCAEPPAHAGCGTGWQRPGRLPGSLPRDPSAERGLEPVPAGCPGCSQGTPLGDTQPPPPCSDRLRDRSWQPLRSEAHVRMQSSA